MNIKMENIKHCYVTHKIANKLIHNLNFGNVKRLNKKLLLNVYTLCILSCI